LKTLFHFALGKNRFARSATTGFEDVEVIFQTTPPSFRTHDGMLTQRFETLQMPVV
jgi:hypothetical protein